ncbi:hypothetical protein GCM10028808_08880 [Spirosoma migulaei]
MAGRADLTVSGAGHLTGSELTIDGATIDLNGASEANIRVSGTLKATTDGVSELRYSGNPTVKSVKAMGLSNIERN